MPSGAHPEVGRDACVIWETVRLGTPSCCELTFAELEALACLFLSVLLTLDHAGIARQQSGVAELRAIIFINEEKSTCDAHLHRASLAVRAATAYADEGIVAIIGFGNGKGHAHLVEQKLGREVFADLFAVDSHLARSGGEERAGDCCFPAPDGYLMNHVLPCRKKIDNFDSFSVDGKDFGLLCLMRMVSVRVHLQLLDNPASETVVRQHAFDGVFDHIPRIALHQIFEHAGLGAAGIAGMREIRLLLETLARDANLIRVDDDHEITRVDMRRKDRLVLSAKYACDVRREPTKDKSVGVDDIPFLVDLDFLGLKGSLGGAVAHM